MSLLLPPALDWRGAAALRALRRAAHPAPVEREPVELHSTAGYKLAAQLIRPKGAGPLPGLVVSPAIHQGIEALSGRGAVVDGAELASLGFAVLLHDPAGRGASWGEEDFGGPEHQDDVRVCVRSLAANPACTGRVGLLSLSLGVAAAVGAAARWPELPIDWLVDWEGPCDREIITAGGTRLEPAAGHPLDDDDYWASREAVRGVTWLRCGYLRLQAFPDHAQPEELRHARRMVHAAARGPARFVQLNDHPMGQVPARPDWLAGGAWAANRAILSALRRLRR